MKKLFLFCMLLIGCKDSKVKSKYILTINSVKEGSVRNDHVKVDTIYAVTDTAAFSEATRRTTKYFITEEKKAPKDSSWAIRYSFTVTDHNGNNLTKILNKKYIDSVIRATR